MKINISFKEFKRNHFRKKHQVLFKSRSCKEYFRVENLFRHQLLIKYLKNTSWLFLEKVFRISVGLFVGAWMARYLEPNAFGLYSYALSFVGLFAIVSNLGLASVLVKELVNHETKSKELINT